MRVLLQVDDGSGIGLRRGAVDYEEALASVPPEVDTAMTPDDLYVLYTGGTTGMPKGVLWRQGDIVPAALGVRNRRDNREWLSLAERLSAVPRRPQRVMPLAPYMHGTAQWVGSTTPGGGVLAAAGDVAVVSLNRDFTSGSRSAPRRGCVRRLCGRSPGSLSWRCGVRRPVLTDGSYVP